jgi:aminotransferase EvaB
MSIQTTAIRMFDYRQQYAAIQTEILEAISQVLDSGTLILGPRVQTFEENFAHYLGVSGHAIGVGNGTDALAIALRALGVGPGDEVLTVSNTAIPTVSAIRMVGATPVFCDVDPQTFLLDLAELERHITPRAKAVIPVHLFGNAVNMSELLAISSRHGLRVIEDCAQASGTTFAGRAVGTFGDVGCFSFYPTKNLGAYGDGGLCFSRDTALAIEMRRIRMYGCDRTYYSLREGINSRLDELQAAVLDVKLRYLDEYVRERRRVAAVYDNYLRPAIGRPRITQDAEASYHLYVIEVERREDLIARLKSEDIGFGIHYPTPIHRMSGYEFLGLAAGSLPVTERLAERILSLPCYPELSTEAVRRVCTVVNEHA